MTTIRISGPSQEIDKIYSSIRDVIPEIIETSIGRDNSLVITCIEPLQQSAKGQVQDWMIIEYCQTWRTTPEIMKYFKMEYGACREICDRLYAGGALGRRLMETNKHSAYGYIDRKNYHTCQECSKFKLEDSRSIDGICMQYGHFNYENQLACDNFVPKEESS